MRNSVAWPSGASRALPPVGRLALTLAMMTAMPAERALATATQPVWVGIWQGTIGKAAVQVCLQHKAYDDFGAYYYLRHLGIISLGRQGPQGPQGTWTEAPHSDQAAKGPLWRFVNVSSNQLQGIWTQGAKSLPFSLKRVPMAKGVPDDDGSACGNEAFSLPRFTKPVITTRSARLMGFPYTRVFANPGKQFEASSTETIQLPGTSSAIHRVNSRLYETVPTSAKNAMYFTCSMAALGQNGLDGDASTTIKPLIMTKSWLVIQHSESDDCGGAHPNSNVSYETWDLRRGVKTNLYEWFNPAALTQVVNDPGTKSSYVRVVFTARFKAMLFKALPKIDAECRDVLSDADSWTPRLTRKGVAFTPDLPHATQACADDAEISFASVDPYLSPGGKRAVAGFIAELRQASSSPRN